MEKRAKKEVHLTPLTALRIGQALFSNTAPLALIAGPCQMEGATHALTIAAQLQKITERLQIPFVFKTSFDKANRTSGQSPRGLGLAAALPIFHKIRTELGIPVLTDVHLPEHCAEVAEAVDVLQIPAFLCRQTDLLWAAAETGRIINVKKAQFLAPEDMSYVIDKLLARGNNKILLTERGTCFGYHRLVNDFRALPLMADLGPPVIFDATHSVQEPGSSKGVTGGERRFVAPLARAATAIGIAGLFIETHESPDSAPSDGPTMLPLGALESLLRQVVALDQIVKEKAQETRLKEETENA